MAATKTKPSNCVIRFHICSLLGCCSELWVSPHGRPSPSQRGTAGLTELAPQLPLPSHGWSVLPLGQKERQGPWRSPSCRGSPRVTGPTAGGQERRETPVLNWSTRAHLHPISTLIDTKQSLSLHIKGFTHLVPGGGGCFRGTCRCRSDSVRPVWVPENPQPRPHGCTPECSCYEKSSMSVTPQKKGGGKRQRPAPCCGPALRNGAHELPVTPVKALGGSQRGRARK